jgi:putative spermidine/putrescine transport system ATP-binding protein
MNETASANEPYIRFDRVTKSFGALTVIKDLDLAIAKGEFVSLLGPSGSGKTTLLMMLAGFENPTAGSVSVGGQRVDQLPPHKRNMGVVFQNYALFPHMSVADNVAFPLEMRGVGKAEREERVERALDMVQLKALKARRPSQLSGGQQQRVALARALVFEPGVVLMDEPLGALDKKLREQMQLDIRALHKRLGLTIVFVTHDQSEALTMSDRIAVFNHGRIEQIGAPGDIYDRPRTRFVAEFIGETNLLDGAVERVEGAHALVALPQGLKLPVEATMQMRPGDKATISLRPEKIHLGRDASEPGETSFPVGVVDAVYHGDHFRVQLDEAGAGLIVKSDRRQGEWRAGQRTRASFAPADCWVVGAESEA